MTIRDLLSVIDKGVVLNIVSEHIHWLYEDKADKVPCSLINRKIKMLDACKDELFIMLRED